jgi:hypothetical protein
MKKSINIKAMVKFKINGKIFLREADAKDISEAYREAKDNGSNSELVRLIEESVILTSDMDYSSFYRRYITDPFELEGWERARKALPEFMRLELTRKLNQVYNDETKYFSKGGIIDEIEKIKNAYISDSNYFEGLINGQGYKIRMNKNHPRNFVRNDDSSIHNLSLINIKYPSGIGTRIVYGKIQRQVDNITDWEDAEVEIEDFLNEINTNEYNNGGIIGKKLFGGVIDSSEYLFDIALSRKTEGISSEKIFYETGYFIGLDGKWRTEIDDSSYFFKFSDQRLLSYYQNNKAIPLSLLINHDDFFRMFPKSKNISVYLHDIDEHELVKIYDLSDLNAIGEFIYNLDFPTKFNFYKINLYIDFKYIKEHGKQRKQYPSESSAELVILHELQHVFQSQRAFGKSTSFSDRSEQIDREIREVRIQISEISDLKDSDVPNQKIDLENLFNYLVKNKYLLAYDKYQKDPAEIEAREVVTRFINKDKSFPKELNRIETKLNYGGSLSESDELERIKIQKAVRKLIEMLNYKSMVGDRYKSKEDLFIDRVVELIYNGKEFKSKLDIERIAEKEFGFNDKQKVRELTEYAVLIVGRDISAKYNVNEAYPKLVSLYSNQPYSTHRTNISVAYGQFSTPIPIAYLMGIYVGVNKKEDKVFFEPCAGNGALSIAGNTEDFVVNELDANRYNNLIKESYKQVLNQDANLPFNFDFKFDGMLANPPFASTSEKLIVNGYKISGLEQQIIIRSLRYLKDEAKVAFIIGGHTEYDSIGRISSLKDKAFLSYLYSVYYIDDVININGSLYGRQGTTFPIRVILIRGKKYEIGGFYPLADTESDNLTTFSTKSVNTFEELLNRIAKSL